MSEAKTHDEMSSRDASSAGDPLAALPDDMFLPTPEHQLLSDTLREFVSREVEGQAAEHDRQETFNLALFRKAG